MREHVKEFHRAFGQPAPERPTVPDQDTIDLRVRLVSEEFAEVMGAMFNASEVDVQALAKTVEHEVHTMTTVMREGRFPEADMRPRVADLAKELADLRYVVDGTAVAFGIPAEAVFEAVHRSNMSKLGADGKPMLRDDGKALKGPNYEPAEPLVRAILYADPVAKAYGENSGR